MTQDNATLLCRVLHEPGRNPPHAQINAFTPVIFAGVWLLVSPVSGCIRMLANKPPPAQWEGFPYALRQSFPIIETLDGRLLYPHFTKADRMDVALGNAIAIFLGLETMNSFGKNSDNRLNEMETALLPGSPKKDGS